MGTKAELASHYHDQGLNCAQSVLAAFAADFGLDERTALRISTGFGSGMGRLCEVCGALTGAFMVIGLGFGRAQFDGTKYGPETETTYRLVTDIAGQFKDRNGSIYCRDLVGHDLAVPGERDKAREEGVFSTVCAKCIRDASELTEEALRSNAGLPLR